MIVKSQLASKKSSSNALGIALSGCASASTPSHELEVHASKAIVSTRCDQEVGVHLNEMMIIEDAAQVTALSATGRAMSLRPGVR